MAPGLQFIVPPGIGDTGWIYSKVEALALQRRVSFFPCNDPPRRALPYLQLLPNIYAPGYANVAYRNSRKLILHPGADLSKLANGTYHVSLNSHLEAGRRLEEAFPAQATNLHYNMKLPASGGLEKRLDEEPGLRIGFYCSSNRHRGELRFWDTAQWVQFLEGVKKEVGPCTFVAVGAPYDDRTVDVAARLTSVGHHVLSFFGQDIGHTMNLMLRMHYFFAFPSGLGISADVLNLPCMMWFWGNLPRHGHMKGIFTSWADPKNLESGQMLVAPYDSVEAGLKLFVERGKRHVKPA